MALSGALVFLLLAVVFSAQMPGHVLPTGDGAAAAGFVADSGKCLDAPAQQQTVPTHRQ